MATQVLLAWAGAWGTLCFGHDDGPHLGCRLVRCEHDHAQDHDDRAHHHHPGHEHSSGAATSADEPQSLPTLRDSARPPSQTPCQCRHYDLPVSVSPVPDRSAVDPRDQIRLDRALTPSSEQDRGGTPGGLRKPPPDSGPEGSPAAGSLEHGTTVVLRL